MDTGQFLATSGNDGITLCWLNEYFTHTKFEANSWWRVDFGRTRQTLGGLLWGRCDCCQDRLDGFLLWIGDSPTYNGQGNTVCYNATTTEHHTAPFTHAFTCIGQGRYFFVHLPSNLNNPLSLIEVEVQGRGLGKPASLMAICTWFLGISPLMTPIHKYFDLDIENRRHSHDYIYIYTYIYNTFP